MRLLRFRRVATTAAVTLAVSGAPVLPFVPAAPAAAADGLNPIIHAGAGRPIDVLNVGDSYGAGNGGGAGTYYHSTPDDPTPPASGADCYRSWNNSSFLAYKALRSRGSYVNRACSNAVADQVAGQVADLPSAYRDTVDLITLSIGGNDAKFPDMAWRCLTAPIGEKVETSAYGWVTRACVDTLATLRAHATTVPPAAASPVVTRQAEVVQRLLRSFDKARLVVSGYPMLITKSIPGHLVTAWVGLGGRDFAKIGINNWLMAYHVLAEVQPDIARQQSVMVERLNSTAEFEGRVAFNDVYKRFGGAAHSVGSDDAWIIGPQRPLIAAENYHPTPHGWQVMANGIRDVVNARGWFAAWPEQRKPALRFNYIPGVSDGDAYPLADDRNRFYLASRGNARDLAGCRETTIASEGRIEQGRWVVLTPRGLDVMIVECRNPRVGDILGHRTMSFHATPGSSYNVMPGVTPRQIPTAWMYRCLDRGVRHYQLSALMAAAATSNAPVAGTAACVPSGWRNRVLRAPNGSSWFVDTGGVRHHIRTTDTYHVLVARYGARIDVSPQVDVDTIPRGADQPDQLYGPGLEGRIIRRTDGVSWVVLSGVRHHIPTYAADLCTRYVHRRAVARTGLSVELAGTLPEGAAYACDLDGRILRANDKPDPKPSYAFHGGRRHWIPDAWTFRYLTARGYQVVDVPTEGEITRLADGGTEPAKLDPGHVTRNSIIRRNDGVSWVVDGSGVRHHIPYAQDDVCWRRLRGLSVTATGLTAAQANALPEADRWPCIIGDRIVRSDNSAIYFVDRANVRHWIPDMETYGVLVKSYPDVGTWPAADVNLLPEGSRMTHRIDAGGVLNSIICRNDGVCWAVDGGGTRHHIPTYADNVCWRWVNGWRVTRTGLNYEQSASLPEGGAWGCNLGGRIIATNEGAAYFMDGNTRRWIQDPESFHCYADRGHPVIRGMAMSEARGIPEGGWMPRCLSPNRVKWRIVRVHDGTSYFVDGAGYWYWIPNGDVWYCLTRKYPVLIWDATWEQVNSIRRERGVWANCSM